MFATLSLKKSVLNGDTFHEWMEIKDFKMNPVRSEERRVGKECRL